GSAAEKAGIAVDDRIEKINGETVSKRRLSEWRGKLRELPVGTKLHLATRPGAAQRKTRLVLPDIIPDPPQVSRLLRRPASHVQLPRLPARAGQVRGGVTAQAPVEAGAAGRLDDLRHLHGHVRGCRKVEAVPGEMDVRGVGRRERRRARLRHALEVEADLDA